MDPASQPPLLRCPPEVRNIIYSLLIQHPTSIKIRSPRKKRGLRRNSTTFKYSILHVNKQIRYEASSMFYGTNTFIIGNGPWGSTEDTNLHGLKAFISRVPHISQIKKVQLDIHSRRAFTIPAWYRHTVPPPPQVLGGTNDAVALHSINRALLQHFTALERVEYQVHPTGPYLQEVGQYRKLSREEAIEELSQMLRTLLKHKNLKEVLTFNDAEVDMQTAVDRALEANSEAGKVLRRPVQDSKDDVTMDVGI
jgi:hypothetical protein